tara:strand:+ start:172 stop:375 length:204 start_codon:yes stop_codon:yes gene_type:complete
MPHELYPMTLHTVNSLLNKAERIFVDMMPRYYANLSAPRRSGGKSERCANSIRQYWFISEKSIQNIV